MYIAIAGNIGSGKTTLTEILTRHYNAKAYYEESNNPYIGDFYNDMQRWAFHLQIYFLGSRIQQTLDMLASGDDVIVQDRTIYEDAHIFADYLCRLNTKYEHWVNDIYDGEVLLVDKDTEDFVENPAVLEKICRRIDRLRNEQKR